MGNLTIFLMYMFVLCSHLNSEIFLLNLQVAVDLFPYIHLVMPFQVEKQITMPFFLHCFIKDPVYM